MEYFFQRDFWDTKIIMTVQLTFINLFGFLVLSASARSSSIFETSVIIFQRFKRFKARMILSSSPTFEMEKLKKQTSGVHQNLDDSTYKEVVQAVRSQKNAPLYVTSFSAHR